MPVLLKGGQCASREEAVEEMKDCRSTVHLCHRSTVMPEYGLSIFYDRLVGENIGTPSESFWNFFGVILELHWYIHMSTRSSKGIWLLLVEPLDLERVIHKSKRAVDTLQAAIGSVEIQATINTIIPRRSTLFTRLRSTLFNLRRSILFNWCRKNTVHHDTVHRSTVYQGTIHQGTVHLDTVHPPSIDTVHPPSIDTVHSTSIDTVHSTLIDTVHLTLIDIVHHSSIDIVCHDTVHRDTVHHDTVHRGTVHPMTDTTCVEKKKVEVLILKVDENGLLRDEAGRTRNSALQLINSQGDVILDVIDVAEMNDFDLSREWYDWVSQDPFQTTYTVRSSLILSREMHSAGFDSCSQDL
ncbi:hypothetical protein F2Q70_00015462 [Brassica cretica]|uniref:Uncharacterized protein n=1 Tax=Brassica cretica TaxID=69181 RepID=A0A8S9HR35_BRACR|nr:hypothetical protein F2Q70_00015462 [Brassica cretica]